MQKPSTHICSACRTLLSTRSRARNERIVFAALNPSAPRQYTTRPFFEEDRTRRARTWINRHTRHASKVSRAAVPATQPDLNTTYSRVQELTASILQPKDGAVPPEQRILFVLEQFDAIARSLADPASIAGAATANKGPSGKSATSALLGSVNLKRVVTSASKASVLSLIGQSSEEMITDPNVFINAPILKAYVELQALLQQPYTFPSVFELYASKPIPKSNADGSVTLTPSKPNQISSAIERDTANSALAAALTAHDLPLALSIVETSFALPAYIRAKITKQCALPGAGLAAAPFVAYGASVQFGAWQSMLDPAQAAGMAFAGIMTYMAAVATVGYVAITTGNDQMDRVTWAQGMPLWERWAREDERAAFDRIAAAWGFKSSEKRGDEVGQEWELLRETCGVKGMVLDKVELMEGME